MPRRSRGRNRRRKDAFGSQFGSRQKKYPACTPPRLDSVRMPCAIQNAAFQVGQRPRNGLFEGNWKSKAALQS
jgi:hypothetical protein